VLIVLAPGQWRAATHRPLQTRVKVQIVLGLVINTALLLNAAGWPFAPMGGLVMLAISWNLFAFFLQFAESIRFFFEEEETGPDQEAASATRLNRPIASTSAEALRSEAARIPMPPA